MPLPLQHVVGPIPGVVGTTWHGIAMSCHISTLLWLHHAQTGAAAANPAAVPKLISFNPILKRIIARGIALRINRLADLMLAPGSVLVFEEAGEPGHSCIAATATRIDGYNQVDWFRSPGIAAGFSQHPIGDIRWLLPFPTERVVGAHNHICRLFMIPGAAAVEEYVRYA